MGFRGCEDAGFRDASHPRIPASPRPRCLVFNMYTNFDHLLIRK